MFVCHKTTCQRSNSQYDQANVGTVTGLGRGGKLFHLQPLTLLVQCFQKRLDGVGVGNVEMAGV